MLLSHELDVERPGDVEGLADRRRDSLDPPDGLYPQLLGRQEEGGVSGVNAGVLFSFFVVAVFRHNTHTANGAAGGRKREREEAGGGGLRTKSRRRAVKREKRREETGRRRGGGRYGGESDDTVS